MGLRTGRLVVVGTGIQYFRDMTLGAIAQIKAAEQVYYLVTDVLTEDFIKELNPNCHDLSVHYQVGLERSVTYQRIFETVAQSVRAGWQVCVVAYGHPGVFAGPPHRLMEFLGREGYSVEMLPAVSAEDCLFADIGIDPGAHGCQSYEASDFISRAIKPLVNVPLILWQVGVVGVTSHPLSNDGDWSGVKRLQDYLLRFYPACARLVIYEASQLPITRPRIVRCTLEALSDSEVRVMSTMYVPPLQGTGGETG